MGQNNLRSTVLIAVLPLFGGLAAIGIIYQKTEPQLREVTFEAEKYAYHPARLHVNLGDTLTIRVVSKDVTHGFYLEGFDLEAYARAQFPYFFVKAGDGAGGKNEYEMVETYTLIADKIGKFRYRCSVTCGTMHPFMQGELIVGPNYPYAASIGLMVGVMMASLVGFGWGSRRSSNQ